MLFPPFRPQGFLELPVAGHSRHEVQDLVDVPDGLQLWIVALSASSCARYPAPS